MVPTCASPGAYHAHHVVYEQVLRRAGLRGNALYDPRNAVRLCLLCHQRHHQRIAVVRTGWLPTAAIIYAFELLNLRAADYLRQYYDDSIPDDRIVSEVDLRRGW